ncbi:MAG TPA: hypothetical protein VH678_15930 [Xanthobacteraceae bacterium]|jgi:hypothetical protein
MDHLAQAERHVVQGEQHVTRQRDLVARLQMDGHDTDEALKLLSQFEELLAVHIADRDRLKAELAELG